jgi:hypothetical protein
LGDRFGKTQRHTLGQTKGLCAKLRRKCAGSCLQAGKTSGRSEETKKNMAVAAVA